MLVFSSNPFKTVSLEHILIIDSTKIHITSLKIDVFFQVIMTVK